MAVAYPWTAIVLTCQDASSSHTYQTELEARQRKGQIREETIILTVEDPRAAVGSGGATLNALLVVCEHISAKQGFTVINPDVLQDAHILILHLGRNFLCDPCGRAFVTLPIQHDNDVSLMTNLDLLLDNLSNTLAVNSPPGLWVCSTDMLLNIPSKAGNFDWEGVDVCAVTVPGDAEYATLHGVYKLSEEGLVKDIFYQGEKEQVDKCKMLNGQVPMVSGVEFFSSQVCERMLALIAVPPLDACTYMGLDSGVPPIQISVFFDFMLGMCDGLSKEAFVYGERSGHFGRGATDAQAQELATIQSARRRIWKELHEFKISSWFFSEGSHSYMSLQPKDHLKHMGSLKLSGSYEVIVFHSLSQNGSSADFVMVNSLVEEGVVVGEGSVLQHCHLTPGLSIGKHCCVYGIKPQDIKFTNESLGDSQMLQTFHVHLPTLGDSVPQRVYTVWGVNDDLQMPVSQDKATYCGMKWKIFQELSGIFDEDLWDNQIKEKDRNLLNAKLFPVFCATKSISLVEYLWLQAPSTSNNTARAILDRWRSSWRMSLVEILSFVSIAEEFSHRKHLFYTIGERQIRDILLNQRDDGLCTLYTSSVVDGFSLRLLETLDLVAKECGHPGIAARTMANIADVLGAMSRGTGGLRSGPAGNKQWTTAFALLEEGAIFEGIEALRSIRDEWIHSPYHQVRAARHYEGAAQILIRHAVMTGRKWFFMGAKRVALYGPSLWKQANRKKKKQANHDSCLHVFFCQNILHNMSTVLFYKPIGAKARRIPEPQLILVIQSECSDETVVVTKLSQLGDYSHPHAPGALLKTAFICCEIIDYPSSVSLHDQLLYKYEGGFEIRSWSNMPHGSGLGTSSILAGAVMAALWRTSGRRFDISSLLHAVLHLEQMLTTGGGWQDQIGGLCPGIKVGHSPPKLPLEISVTFPDISDETVRNFNDRLALVYTGKTRLAKNLLQSVVRNWYARNPDILKTEDELVELAWDCARGFEKGDMDKVGSCINDFQKHKKFMAPGSEPLAISRMMAAVEPYVHGVSLAGAGGGGFIFFLTKERNATSLLRNVLSGLPDTEHMTFHKAEIDTTGLTLEVEGIGREMVKMKF
ncbi:hypothetical protein CAPTEDRAFT_168292 [Capitella teleta]|uniref:L-fucokinase domain-containing protein n=1 Tax=Capitella teleta TaxID=283909 RepID=R7U270_CAPTE|nr:hypothetical protein CAPTEDRAFT_168292 [Capitella teleta]|eukprot:ELU00095.1 hypothetical protein CAPTEDRAFT_168292 [Capitella teleta]